MQYKLGSIITEATGKLGGMVLMGKGNGGVMRVSAHRAVTASLVYTNKRQRFVLVQRAWRSMSESNKLIWNIFAKSLGSEFSSNGYYALSGYELYLKLNLFKTIYSGTIRLLPVRRALLPYVLISSGSCSVSASSLIINTNFIANSNQQGFFFISNSFSQGSNSLSQSMRYMIGSNYTLGNSRNFWSQYFPRWKVFPLAGSRLLVKLVVVDLSSDFVINESFCFIDVLP